MGAEEGAARWRDEALALVASAAYVSEGRPLWMSGKVQQLGEKPVEGISMLRFSQVDVDEGRNELETGVILV